MAVQRGKDLLLKVDSTGSGAYLSVAGLRTRRLAFSTGTVDVTNADSPGEWRELLAGAAPKRASMSGTGIFRDVQSDTIVRQIFFDAAIRNWQVVIPSFGIVEGPFQIAALEFIGEHDGEVVYDLALESAGLLTFTAI
ncbi:phage major tail protein, TP901-1 family [Prosthecomicrobium sp. N25]|uniref:phage major tail protein, TP901-1 family n=1 Tax=Prosthecomicrobium sp. N25 TaxID=3129254 RepID=UPI0030769B84